MNCSKSQGNQQLSELIIVSTLHDKSVMPPHPNGDHTETRKFELENENSTEPLALVTCWFFTLAADSAWITAIAITIDCREDVDSITTVWTVTGRLRNKAKESQDE